MNKTVLNALWTRIGQVFANKAEVSSAMLGKQDVLTPGDGIEITNGVIKNTFGAQEEIVQIVVTTNVTGVSVSGLQINVYYNGATSPTTTLTTDQTGMAAIRIPNGYQYKLTFPKISGCSDITPVQHTASIGQRSVEIRYVSETADGEQMTVFLGLTVATALSNVSNADVVVTYDNKSTTYTTNSEGRCSFIVPYGKTYTVTAPNREGYYIHGGSIRTFTADSSSKATSFYYYTFNSGLFIVTNNGDEYRLDEWQEALENETVTNQDAVLLKVATTTLANNGGVFGVLLDTLAERTNAPTKAWNPDNVLFNSIPLNGNSASAAYYYDGKTSSELILAEGDERVLDTPAVDFALSLNVSIGEGTLPGFLGSVGQWTQLWANRIEVDDILAVVRPGATYKLSTWTTYKWTSTQSSATYAWSWTSTAGSNGKGNLYVVVPFFAF